LSYSKDRVQGQVGIVTSYNPLTRDITTENTGANSDTDKEFIYNTYTELLKAMMPGRE